MKRTTAGLLLALSAAFATQAEETAINAQAETQQTTIPAATPRDIQYASGLHLAYIITPSSASNDMAKRGLEALAIALLERTSVEPKGVVGLNIERDDISLFPILYWPVTKETQPLSEAAELRVNRYLARGGVIIFDSRDDAAVARLVNGLSVGHLVEAGPDHSLTRSFYLVSSLEGTNNSKPVLIQSPRTSSENVTQVIVGSRNWAGAWSGTTLGPMSREREMALRAGINMVLFALTGTYKEDQIHMKSILEKLGKPAPKQ